MRREGHDRRPRPGIVRLKKGGTRNLRRQAWGPSHRRRPGDGPGDRVSQCPSRVTVARRPLRTSQSLPCTGQDDDAFIIGLDRARQLDLGDRPEMGGNHVRPRGSAPYSQTASRPPDGRPCGHPAWSSHARRRFQGLCASSLGPIGDGGGRCWATAQPRFPGTTSSESVT